MSDKNEKWNDCLDNSCEYPEALSGVEDRLEKRIVKEKRKRRALFSSISAVAASLLFVLLVNTSTAFASIVSEIPVIGKLAQYVKFDKGLVSAIENDYAQEVNLTSFDGDEKLLLPYVIADEKNLVLFFQLPQEFKQESNQWVNIKLQNMTNGTSGEKVEGFGYSTSSLPAEGRAQYNGLIMQDYHFTESTLPKSIDIEVISELETFEGAQDEKALNVSTDTAAEPIKEKIGTFKFHIDFDEFAKPIIYTLNEKHTIFDQSITVKDMKVYPTGTEVTFVFPEENSAWIRGLDLAIEQDGETALKGSGGISATYDEGNSWMSVYIESNYFEEPKKQDLLIKGIRLLDKDDEFITIDLDNKTITPVIDGTELIQVTKRTGKADLIFSPKVPNEDYVGMFSNKYKDAEGNTYKLNQEENSTFDSQMETRITVEYPASGKIILQRSLTPKVMLEDPIRINLPSLK